MDIHSVIERIRKRPAMYLGCESITRLWIFLLGYGFAELDYKVKRKKEDILPLDFSIMHEFIEFRLGVCNSKSWSTNILESCNGDEKAALY